MSWWRRLRREPTPPRGRHRRGTPADPAELTERLTGMLAAYVSGEEQPAARAQDSAGHDAYDPAAPERPAVAREAYHPAGPQRPAAEQAGSDPAAPGRPAVARDAYHPAGPERWAATTRSDPAASNPAPGTVVLGFADGSSVELAPGDSRARPFLTLADALTVP